MGQPFSPIKRELLPWAIVIVQSFVILHLLNNEGSHNGISLEYSKMLMMNNHPNQYYKAQKLHANDTSALSPWNPYYEQPILHHKDAGLVSRVWRSNSSPSIHSGLKRGSCWCSADEWCMCTPSLAIDVILISGPDHVWLVRFHKVNRLNLVVMFITHISSISHYFVSDHCYCSFVTTLYYRYGEQIRAS